MSHREHRRVRSHCLEDLRVNLRVQHLWLYLDYHESSGSHPSHQIGRDHRASLSALGYLWSQIGRDHHANLSALSDLRRENPTVRDLPSPSNR